MLARTQSCAIVGLDGYVVEVEVDISPGLPAFHVVGLPDAAVQEARERVRASIRNSGCEFPMRRITASLAPADLRKAGPAYDLPIAVAVLLGAGQIPGTPPLTMFLGELALDGQLRHTNGILPMAAVAKEEGFQRVFVPEANAKEAALVSDIEVIPVRSLAQAVSHLRGDEQILPWSRRVAPVDGHAFGAENGDAPRGETHRPSMPLTATDLSDIRGQENAKRALEVAAAGAHNLLMVGPPGSGKTLLARSMPSIVPTLDNREALEVTKIYSVSGLLPSSSPLIDYRPYRAPHYTISNAGLVGGGSIPRPGEVTLSHRGVLFLDELPEFGHTVLEVLRQPIEDKIVTISRAKGSVTYPANFILVGAMNPCPCGYYGDPAKNCVCGPSNVSRYQNRISGPLLDRMDVFVDVPRIEYDKLVSPPPSETSSQVRERIEKARETQRARFEGTNLTTNSEMGPVHVWEYCQLDDPSQDIMRTAMKRMNLSARGFHRIQKLARTIADLEGDDDIDAKHLAEALQYRPTVWA